VELIKLLGGKGSKEILLFGDGVYYASSPNVAKFKGIGVEKTYVVKENLEERGVSLAPECTALSYDDIVPLIMDKHEKILLV
jgi:sulfur relay protein TusB/DsrH